MDSDKVYNLLEKIEARLDSIDVTLVRNDTNLKIHMKRADQLEKHVLVLENYVREQMAPLQDHVTQVRAIINFLLKSLGVAVALATILGILLSLKG